MDQIYTVDAAKNPAENLYLFCKSIFKKQKTKLGRFFYPSKFGLRVTYGGGNDGKFLM